MTMAMTEKTMGIDERHRPLPGNELRLPTTCTRCGGLMVQEHCLDLFRSTSELECAALRCIQCGDIIDAVILRNRCLRAESMTVRNQ